ANQGFTPAAWVTFGADLGFADASFFYGTSWTKDSGRQFSIVQDGSIRVIGGELRAAVPEFGPIWGTLAHIRARAALFTAPAYEVLYSSGGRGLTQNFFGPDSDNGTGEILTSAIGVTWQPYLAATGLFV